MLQNDTLINIARFCFGLNMFTTLPLELFVCREVIEQYFFDNEPFHMQRHVFFTTAILMSSMISMCQVLFHCHSHCSSCDYSQLRSSHATSALCSR